MKVQVIVPTAGLGERFNSKQPKSLVSLAGKPIFLHCLEIFESSDVIDSIILVVPKDYLKDFQANVDLYNITKVKNIVEGGATRCASVSNGLNNIDDDTEIVMVHDGARPLIKASVIEKVVRACQEASAAVVAVPVISTIKKVDNKDLHVKETVERSELWEIQTPQAFRKDVLLNAHRENTDPKASDDALLVERLGINVKVVEGQYQNLKITTPDDLIMAEALYKKDEN